MKTKVKIKLPHQIIVKSKKWYYDTVNDKHIHKDNIKTYLTQITQLQLNL